MKVLDSVLTANKSFLSKGVGNFQIVPKLPHKQLAIFTCMDTRLVEFLEPALGIERGDAKIIKNAGNTIVDPTGGVIRSLVAAIFLLGVEEILIVGHKDCGMANIDEHGLKERMLARGITPEAISSIPNLKQWIGAINNPQENTINVVNLLRDSPLIPKDIPIHGLLFCPDTGEIEVLIRGYQTTSSAQVKKLP